MCFSHPPLVCGCGFVSITPRRVCLGVVLCAHAFVLCDLVTMPSYFRGVLPPFSASVLFALLKPPVTTSPPTVSGWQLSLM